MNKGGKFLTKLWCCVDEGVSQDDLVLAFETSTKKLFMVATLHHQVG